MRASEGVAGAYGHAPRAEMEAPPESKQKLGLEMKMKMKSKMRMKMEINENDKRWRMKN